MRSSTATIAEYGLRLRLLDEYCLVEQVVPYSAADQCGLECGDVVEQVDNQPVERSLPAIVRSIRGKEGSTCELRVLKHIGTLGNFQTLFLEQIGVWLQQKPNGSIAVARVLDNTAARYCGQCAVGDVVASVSYIAPRSLDEVDQIVSGSDQELLDLELQVGANRTCTVHLMKSGEHGARALVPFELEEEEAGVGLRVAPGDGGMVVVVKIDEGSPAYWSDLRVGDVLSHVNGDLVVSAASFLAQVWGLLGTRVNLTVERRVNGEGGATAAVPSGSSTSSSTISIALVRAKTLSGLDLTRANKYRDSVLHLLQQRLAAAAAPSPHKDGSVTSRSVSPPPVLEPSAASQAASTPGHVPLLSLSALDSAQDESHRLENGKGNQVGWLSPLGGRASSPTPSAGRRPQGGLDVSSGYGQRDVVAWMCENMLNVVSGKETPLSTVFGQNGKGCAGSNRPASRVSAGSWVFDALGAVSTRSSGSSPRHLEAQGESGYTTPRRDELREAGSRQERADAGVEPGQATEQSEVAREEGAESSRNGQAAGGVDALVLDTKMDKLQDVASALAGEMRSLTERAIAHQIDTDNMLTRSEFEHDRALAAAARLQELENEKHTSLQLQLIGKIQHQVGELNSALEEHDLRQERETPQQQHEPSQGNQGQESSHKQHLVEQEAHLVEQEALGQLVAATLQKKRQQQQQHPEGKHIPGARHPLRVAPPPAVIHILEEEPPIPQTPPPTVQTVDSSRAASSVGSSQGHDDSPLTTPRGKTTEEGSKRFMDVMRRARAKIERSRRSRGSVSTTPTNMLPMPPETMGRGVEAADVKKGVQEEQRALEIEEGKAGLTAAPGASRHVEYSTPVRSAYEAAPAAGQDVSKEPTSNGGSISPSHLGIWTSEMNEAWVSGKSEAHVISQLSDEDMSPDEGATGAVSGVPVKREEDASQDDDAERRDDETDHLCGQVSCTLKLDMEMRDVKSLATFKEELVEDVAGALGLHPARVRVIGVRSGSVLVDLQLNPDIDSSEADLVAGLIRQCTDRGSALRRGKHTCKTSSVAPGSAHLAVGAATSPALAHEAALIDVPARAMDSTSHAEAIRGGDSVDDVIGIGSSPRSPGPDKRASEDKSPASTGGSTVHCSKPATLGAGPVEALGENGAPGQVPKETDLSSRVGSSPPPASSDLVNKNKTSPDEGRRPRPSQAGDWRSSEVRPDESCVSPARGAKDLSAIGVTGFVDDLAEEVGEGAGEWLVMGERGQLGARERDDGASGVQDEAFAQESSPFQLSIAHKMAAIDVMQHLMAKVSASNPEVLKSILAEMQHNPAMASDKILQAAADQHSKPSGDMSPGPGSQAPNGRQCSITVRITADFTPERPAATYRSSDLKHRPASTATAAQSMLQQQSMLQLATGDLVLTHFCGDRGWAFGTCIRQSYHAPGAEVGLGVGTHLRSSHKGPRVGLSGWFPWDFVEISCSPVLMRDVSAELVQDYAVRGLSMALCVCGWVSDRDSAMSIRPGQIIHVTEFGKSWSRGRICVESQMHDTSTSGICGRVYWFPSKFVVMILSDTEHDQEHRRQQDGATSPGLPAADFSSSDCRDLSPQSTARGINSPQPPPRLSPPAAQASASQNSPERQARADARFWPRDNLATDHDMILPRYEGPGGEMHPSAVSSSILQPSWHSVHPVPAEVSTNSQHLAMSPGSRLSYESRILQDSRGPFSKNNPHAHSWVPDTIAPLHTPVAFWQSPGEVKRRIADLEAKGPTGSGTLGPPLSSLHTNGSSSPPALAPPRKPAAHAQGSALHNTPRLPEMPRRVGSTRSGQGRHWTSTGAAAGGGLTEEQLWQTLATASSTSGQEGLVLQNTSLSALAPPHFKNLALPPSPIEVWAADEARERGREMTREGQMHGAAAARPYPLPPPPGTALNAPAPSAGWPQVGPRGPGKPIQPVKMQNLADASDGSKPKGMPLEVPSLALSHLEDTSEYYISRVLCQIMSAHGRSLVSPAPKTSRPPTFTSSPDSDNDYVSL